MAIVSPRLLRRGLELFAAISVAGFGALLLYGNNLPTFLAAMASLRWEWVLAGLALASLDWFGGGLRLWVLVRHIYPPATIKGSIVAGGIATWAGYLTPSQAGSGPLMIYAMKRSGIPLPEAVISTFMSFVATVVFFAVAGPLAVFFGAGRSLQRHGVLGTGISLFDLFNLSLGVFVVMGLLMAFAMAFPGVARRVAQQAVGWFESHGSPRMARVAARVRAGVDRAHECVVAYLNPRGLLALGGAIVLSAPSHANKLLAGYFVLRMLGIKAHFVDVLLLQTLITFVLYFAITPGGSGLAELVSAAVMSIYVPRALTPSYILLWRIVVSYLTVFVGSVVFWRWLKRAEDRDDQPLEEEPVPVQVGGAG
ncbi:MAG: flippase-like domain-containing protein [Gemmatimonadetes bacterium]|nr:flippase-like domain-containing protein [Gemmatimonadota bacterium]